MEDSGIDSDSRKGLQDDTESTSSGSGSGSGSVTDRPDSRGGNSYVALQTIDPDSDKSEHKQRSKSSRMQLQNRLEKQLESAKRLRRTQCSEEPQKKIRSMSSDDPVEKPLVQWENESEDEFIPPPLSRAAARELTQQLIREGYDLQLREDEDELDLLPPISTSEGVCCGRVCVIM